MKYIYGCAFATLLLAGCGNQVVIQPDTPEKPTTTEQTTESTESSNTVDSSNSDYDGSSASRSTEKADDDNDKQASSSEKSAPATNDDKSSSQSSTEAVEESSNIGDYSAPSDNLDLYSKAEIDNIVNNMIRPTAYKIKGMVDNKQLSPSSQTSTETTYKVDNITLIIYDDGKTYAEYTYYNNQLFVVVPYVNKKLKNRYYYYNNDLIYILYPDKSDRYRPDFSGQDMQQGIDALNHQFS